MNTSKECGDAMAKLHCTNAENSLFYESISLDLLPDFAARGGLDSGCDLDLIKNYIDKTNSILEVGAGYGRVIFNLLEKGYDKKLVAIERSKRFCDLLKQNYDGKLEVINTDIKIFESSSQFDLILWLWSGICDFSQEEQAIILSKVASFLKKDGVLVVDSLLPSIQPANAETHNEKYSIIPGGNNSKLYVYTPSPEEIKAYSKLAGLDFMKSISYMTTTNRNRMLYLLSRHPFPAD